MKRIAVVILFISTIVGAGHLASNARGADDSEIQEFRMFAESTLSDARKDSNLGTDFADSDVKKAFARDQDVVAVLLRITYRGEKIKEISVYVSHNGNSQVFLVKTLPADHSDVKVIKKILAK